MNQLRKFTLNGLLVIGCLGGALGMSTGAAQAITNPHCKQYSSNVGTGLANVCIGGKDGDSSKVAVSIDYQGLRDDFGNILQQPESPYTIAIEQCDGAGHNCVAVSAGHESFDTFNESLKAAHWSWTTRSVATAFGHTYKTCASLHDSDGWNALNICSAPIAR